jgi:hypothetical protein
VPTIGDFTARVVTQRCLGGGRGSGSRCGCGRSSGGGICLRDMHSLGLGLHDLDAQAALLDLDLAEISFTQDGRELADQTGVEPAILFGRLVGHGRQTLFWSARDQALVPEFFPNPGIAEMHFHDGNGQHLERVVEGDRGVGVAARVYDYRLGLSTCFLHPIHKLAFMVGLAENQRCPNGCGSRLRQFFEVREGAFPVDGGLTLAQTG